MILGNLQIAQNFVIRSFRLGFVQSQQVRNKWTDWRMMRDYKRRMTCVKFADQRLRINAMRKNNILPIEIREMADAEISMLPRDSNKIRCTDRCAVTSRSRGTVHRWRLSRIFWRHLADYNKVSGVIRAHW